MRILVPLVLVLPLLTGCETINSDPKAVAMNKAAVVCGFASMLSPIAADTYMGCMARGKASSTNLLEADQCYRPGGVYDSTTGNRYECIKSLAGVYVTASNSQTGARWTTDYATNGDMTGNDAKNNFWTYTAATKRYHNFGTGQTCVGEGAATTCTP